MNKKKTTALLTAALAAALCLAGCSGEKPPASSQSPDDSAPPSVSQPEAPDSSTGGITPNPLPEDEQVTPEEMDRYVMDESSSLSAETRYLLNTYAANWRNLFRETVSLVIVPSVEEGQGIDEVAAQYREEMELSGKDTILAVNAESWDSILTVGADSILVSAPILPNLDAGDTLEDVIMAKYDEINDYLMGGSGEESPTGPSEADIKMGDEIFKKAQDVLEEYGMTFYDISNLIGNQEQYPGAVIMETGTTDITFQILSGSVDDCDNYWFWYYNQITGPDAVCDENGKPAFIQKFDPTNLYSHKSVSGAVEGQGSDGETVQAYFRADCIGNVCIAVRAKDDSYKDYIDEVFEKCGVPENTNNVI